MSAAPRLPWANVVPLTVVAATVSVGLGEARLWFGVLGVLVVLAAVRDIRGFLHVVAVTLPVTIVAVLFFVYALLATAGEPITADPLNILSWPALVVLFAHAYHRYGVAYFVRGMRQLGVVLLAVAVWGIVEGITHENPLTEHYRYVLGEWRMGTEGYRATGIFGHPIPFAHMIVVGAVIALALERSVVVKTASCLVYAAALVSTQTRSAFVIVAVVAAVALLHLAYRRRAFGVIVGVVIAAPLLLAAGVALVSGPWFADFASGLSDRAGALGADDTSVTQRTESIQAVLAHFIGEGTPVQVLVGFGFAMSNAFMSSVTLKLAGMTTTDNYGVTVLYDFGVVGLVLFVAVVARALWSWWRVDELDDPRAVRVVLAAGAALVATLGFMNVYAFTMWKGTQVVLVLCLTVLIAVRSPRLGAAP